MPSGTLPDGPSTAFKVAAADPGSSSCARPALAASLRSSSSASLRGASFPACSSVVSPMYCPVEEGAQAAGACARQCNALGFEGEILLAGGGVSARVTWRPTPCGGSRGLADIHVPRPICTSCTSVSDKWQLADNPCPPPHSYIHVHQPVAGRPAACAVGRANPENVLACVTTSRPLSQTICQRPIAGDSQAVISFGWWLTPCFARKNRIA